MYFILWLVVDTCQSLCSKDIVRSTSIEIRLKEEYLEAGKPVRGYLQIVREGKSLNWGDGSGIQQRKFYAIDVFFLTSSTVRHHSPVLSAPSKDNQSPFWVSTFFLTMRGLTAILYPCPGLQRVFDAWVCFKVMKQPLSVCYKVESWHWEKHIRQIQKGCYSVEAALFLLGSS